MRTANSSRVGAGGFGIRLSLRKAICLHDGEQNVGRRPTGLTLMLRLHFRQRTDLGRGARSEKSMRLPVVYDGDEKDNVTTGPDLQHFVVAAVAYTTNGAFLEREPGEDQVAGARMARFPACPARLRAGASGPVFCGLSLAARCTASAVACP